jgi:heat shock protein 5
VITNDKGRLSPEDIDRLIKESEEFAEEDKKAKERIDARNQLDNFVFSVKNSVEDPEKLGKKVTEEEKKTVLDAVKEAQTWLDANHEASKEEYEE